MTFIKRYYLELLTFGAVFAVLLIDLNPDYTFMNKGADSIGYIYSARYLYPSYHTSPPLYLLVSHFFLMIPYGTDAWRMALFSMLSTMGACVFIYLIIKQQTSNRFYPLLGVLMYGTGALVISQSTIVQTYPVTCMLATGAYYFAINQKWKLMGLMVGIGLAVHLLMAFVLLVMFIGFKGYRHNWKALAITASFILFYAYIPLTNREPFMWFPDPKEVNSIWAFISDTISVIMMLVGNLSIWALPKRILDTLGIIGVSIGVITIVPIVYYFVKTKVQKNVLFWLILVPVLLFVSELDMNTYDYTMLSLPFLTIAACVGLERMNKPALEWVTLVVLVGFAIFNTNYFDIGRTLDKGLSASRLFYDEFSKIPDKSVFMPNYAWEWEAIYKYNADYGKHIYPVCVDILPSENYRKQLRKDGIKLEEYNIKNTSALSYEIARSIVRLNDNVYTTVSTEPSTFGTKVVKADNPNLIIGASEAELKYLADHPVVLWKPWSPYDIITTSITVTEWRYIIMSNWSVLFFASLASIGLLLHWLLFGAINRKGGKREVTKTT